MSAGLLLMVIDRAGTIRYVNRVRLDPEIDEVLGGSYVDQLQFGSFPTSS